MDKDFFLNLIFPSICVNCKKRTEERSLNTSDCFKAPNPDWMQNRNFLILDDVVTSSSTLLEAVKTLKAAGTKKISGIVAARA